MDMKIMNDIPYWIQIEKLLKQKKENNGALN